MHDEEPPKLYCSINNKCGDQIESNEMGGTCDLHLGKKNIHKSLIRRF